MIASILADVEGLVGVGTGFLVGAAVVLVVKIYASKAQKASLDAELKALRTTAEADAQKIRAQAEAAAKSESLQQREKFDADTLQTRKELRAEEKRLAKREDTIDQKMETASTKERMMQAGEHALSEREKGLAHKDRHLNDLIAQQKSQLMKVANLSHDQAKGLLLDQVEKDIEADADQLIERKLEETRESAEERAREIILQSIQRYAAEHTCDHTVSAVDIPSDDMKGRIIGREGRNIRAFEKATGVDVIVDDTPGVVVCSAFDPIRREVARRSLEKLIQDGRIHPTRIEEVVASVQKDLNKEIVATGKNAVMEANVRGLNPKIVELLGRLHFRTSYGQNILKHSLEVAYLSQVIAE